MEGPHLQRIVPKIVGNGRTSFENKLQLFRMWFEQKAIDKIFLLLENALINFDKVRLVPLGQRWDTCEEGELTSAAETPEEKDKRSMRVFVGPVWARPR